MLGDFPSFAGASTGGIVLGLIIGIPLALVLFSVPTWIASRMVAAGSATFGRAVFVNFLHILASIGLVFASAFLQMLAGGDRMRALSVAIGLCTLSIAIHILIPAKVYRITAWSAFGLNVLSALMAFVIGLVMFLAVASIAGFGNVKAPLEASLQKLQNGQQFGALPSLSALTIFSPPPPPPRPDYSPEIDRLLNVALHPVGDHPSLLEREDIVRSLQEKLKAQRNHLPPGDAHAAVAYQNELNRYLLLLEAVKTERKTHPLRDEVANRLPAPP
jgi:hypothetical protein